MVNSSAPLFLPQMPLLPPPVPSQRRPVEDLTPRPSIVDLHQRYYQNKSKSLPGNSDHQAQSTLPPSRLVFANPTVPVPLSNTKSTVPPISTKSTGESSITCRLCGKNFLLRSMRNHVGRHILRALYNESDHLLIGKKVSLMLNSSFDLLIYPVTFRLAQIHVGGAVLKAARPICSVKERSPLCQRHLIVNIISKVCSTQPR